MKRALLALLVLGGLAAPAFAQQPPPGQLPPDRPREGLPEDAREPLQRIIDDQFADDGTTGDEEWGEDWGEDPFGEEANAAWAAGNAEAGEHHAAHESEFHPQQFFAQAVNFILWLAIVIYLARKPLTEFLKNRRATVEEGLVEAKNLKEAAEAKFDDYSERLERLDEELEKLRDEMVHAAESERDGIIEEAEARAARMRNDAKFVMEQQMKQLRADLTREAIEAAVGAAEALLAKQVQEADHGRLAQNYLEGLATSIEEDEVRA